MYDFRCYCCHRLSKGRRQTPLGHAGPTDLDDDVLQQGVPLDGVEDLGLGLVGEVDRLGVAAAFEVEDAVVVPP